MEKEKGSILSDEDNIREQLRIQEQEEKKRYAKEREKVHENPLGEEHLRRQIPKETDEQREARQEENRRTSPDQKNNGFQPWFDAENQKGLSWRASAQKKIRTFVAHGASYEWVLWKMKRDMGVVTSTARKVIDDALEEEPEKEPEGAPKKKKP
jgi:intein/homing endonuclease